MERYPECTEDGAACPQPEENFLVPTSEDCLFLNVYTTKVNILGISLGYIVT
jgi:carboxylesterase type B